ncbi:hypothetical protein E2562_022080 [Oryza meyeriana var. granulata]|uniref:Uncharacterized protein n=1 Tax=Oryza meyeriana var. granulata TaxID=110450 RepID=A0A6G1ENQ4_9ORYZ|nr:hypothetical protein E2562_022080 [Oryza meyeriana var. granulata]
MQPTLAHHDCPLHRLMEEEGVGANKLLLKDGTSLVCRLGSSMSRPKPRPAMPSSSPTTSRTPVLVGEGRQLLRSLPTMSRTLVPVGDGGEDGE